MMEKEATATNMARMLRWFVSFIESHFNCEKRFAAVSIDFAC
jgi:hypothetical protein